MTAARSLSASLQRMNCILLAGEVAAVPDAELVRRFVEERDEIAFTALVQRYGLLVFGVCRRVLRHEQDAEDAFQATFLVFARDAASVHRAGAIGSWLYGVAHNVSRKAKAARFRRSVKEGEAAASRSLVEAPPVVEEDLLQLVEAEIGLLPDKYRAAIVLCDILGRTTQQAAEEVGCPPKTLGTRLSRGRLLLAQRLTRRGVVLSTTIAAFFAQRPAACAAPPPEQLASTAQVAMDFVTGSGAVPPTVVFLTQGVSKMTLFHSLKYAILASSLICMGAFAAHPIINHVHAMHAAPQSARAATAHSQPRTTEAVPPPAIGHLEQLHRFLIGLLPWDVTTTHTRADDKKDEKPKPLTGAWMKKEGELKIEFAETEMRITPHSDNKVIVIVCEYSRQKNHGVKAKITGFEGKDEVKRKISEKLPVGTEFTFQWKVEKDAAKLEDLKGEKADALKSHLEGDYSDKK